MIRAVLFDYGGVVGEGGRGVDLAKRLCTLLDLPETNATDLFMPLFGKLIRSQIDESEFWQATEAAIGSTVSESQRHAWEAWWSFEPYPEMLELIEKLKANTIAVGLLSNIIPSTMERIRSAGSYDHFDFAILSCEVGYAKPDPEIYDLAVVAFNDLKPEEIVFVDDQAKCMPPAEALGMQTILATSSAQIIANLQALELPV